MKIFIILITLLTGCAQLDTIVTKGAEANDKLMNASIACICQSCSEGSKNRRFDTEDKFYSKELFCGENHDDK